jgi:ribonuclease T1
MRRLLALALALMTIGISTSACESRAVKTLIPIDSMASASLGLDPDSGLALVDLAALPPEAAETMRLIEARGPFPYRQDGAVFENREGILPEADRGYYHEYTVETPGSADRGARRIVVGNQGEAYWTDDHYASFRRIAP